jgi:hypothetical protein
MIYRNRVETETRCAGYGWLITRRKIILDQNVLLTKNLTFFL